MTSVERVEQLLNMEMRVVEKDDAGIITAQGMDSAVKRRAYEECLRILKSEEKKVKV